MVPADGFYNTWDGTWTETGTSSDAFFNRVVSTCTRIAAYHIVDYAVKEIYKPPKNWKSYDVFRTWPEPKFVYIPNPKFPVFKCANSLSRSQRRHQRRRYYLQNLLI